MGGCQVAGGRGAGTWASSRPTGQGASWRRRPVSPWTTRSSPAPSVHRPGQMAMPSGGGQTLRLCSLSAGLSMESTVTATPVGAAPDRPVGCEVAARRTRCPERAKRRTMRSGGMRSRRSFLAGEGGPERARGGWRPAGLLCCAGPGLSSTSGTAHRTVANRPIYCHGRGRPPATTPTDHPGRTRQARLVEARLHSGDRRCRGGGHRLLPRQAVRTPPTRAARPVPPPRPARPWHPARPRPSPARRPRLPLLSVRPRFRAPPQRRRPGLARPPAPRRPLPT